MKRVFILVFLVSFVLVSCSKEEESKSIGKEVKEKKGFSVFLKRETEQKYSEEYECIAEWDEKTIGANIDVPKGIAVDKDGFIYVACLESVNKISPDGKLVMRIEFESEGRGIPEDIALDSKRNIYVCDSLDPSVFVFSPDGKLLMKWGKYGYEEGEFDMLEAIAIDSKDYVYVAGTSKYQVQKFTSDGKYVLGIGKPGVPFLGEPGRELGEFYDAVALAVDSKDNVYIADKPNRRIQKFASNGKFLKMWGREGEGNGEFFRGPIAIAIDSKDFVYVADFEGDIQKFTSDGKFVVRFGREYIFKTDYRTNKEYRCGYFSAITISEKAYVYVCFINYIKKSGKYNDKILIFKKRREQ